jgi:hypothetical protein
MARKCCDGTFVAGALRKLVAGIFFAWGLKGAILDRSKDFTWVLKKSLEFRPLQSRIRTPAIPKPLILRALKLRPMENAFSKKKTDIFSVVNWIFFLKMK